METPKRVQEEDTLKWSLLVAFTIILAGITGFMVVKRHEFFPSMYKHMEQHEAPATKADSVGQEKLHH